jgi:hypothetical protein
MHGHYPWDTTSWRTYYTSEVAPCCAITTLTLAAAGREIALAAVTGLLGVYRVWWEYTAAAPEHPPRWREFELWPGPILWINAGDEPQAGDVVRIWYTKPHTLSGLAAAAATTFPAGHEALLIAGAAGVAALGRALEVSETLTVDGGVGARLREWGALQEARFASALAQLARREAARPAGIAPAGTLDRWDVGEAW